MVAVLLLLLPVFGVSRLVFMFFELLRCWYAGLVAGLVFLMGRFALTVPLAQLEVYGQRLSPPGRDSVYIVETGPISAQAKLP